MKIIIAGAGIGGLACALSLHAAGYDDIEIFEIADEIAEIGVGINLLPHAVRELDELGLLADLYAVAIPTAELSYMTRRGQLVWREARGLEAGYHWPQFSIHRGQLLAILMRAVVERLGEGCIHTGHQFSRFGSDETGTAWGEFMDRKALNNPKRIGADLVVACDGVHSIARKQMYPHEGAPIWNGTKMWRGTTIGDPFLGGRSMFIAGPFVHRVVVYPISKAHENRGQALINWVAEKRVDINQPMPRQDWHHQVDRDEVLKLFENFNFAFLNLPDLIERAEEIFQYPMVDRDPLPSWNQGRVTLLGDAAHPMYPVGSNGASQAILDARTLAFELTRDPDIDRALAAYDRERRPATAAIVAANRQVGPEKCIELAEQRAPQGFDNIDEVVSQSELQAIALAYKKTAGFDPERLNNRASLSTGI